MVHLFLQEAGARYDIARGFRPFGRLNDVVEYFGGACAYCAVSAPLVEEHVVPRNRAAVGLHSWGNVVPACAPCNRIKGGGEWRTFLATREPDGAVARSREARIEQFALEYRYAPATDQLREVVEGLYQLADSQARGLIEFALRASASALDGLAL